MMMMVMMINKPADSDSCPRLFVLTVRTQRRVNYVQTALARNSLTYLLYSLDRKKKIVMMMMMNQH